MTLLGLAAGLASAGLVAFGEMSAALAALLEDPHFRDANWGWAALSNITPAGPFSASVRPPRDQVLRRALNANFRLGEAKNADALVRGLRAAG